MGATWARPVVLLVLAAVAFAACTATDKLPPAGGGGADASTLEPRGAPCVEGTVRECHETLGTHNGVASCYAGSQSCVNGAFGACGGGSVFQTFVPRAAGKNRPLSFSPPTACVDDPCNPYCQQFIEVPEGGGLTPDLVDAADAGKPKNSFGWTQGSQFGYPTNLLAVGTKQPCTIRSDCQFDMHCVGPATGSCEHSVCDAGSALTAGCNDCETEICAANSSCCVPAGGGGKCAHDPCTAGGPLASSCDSCVASVCQRNPNCCSLQWSKGCISAVASRCSPRLCTCAPGQLTNGTDCYQYDSGELDWQDAQAKCQAIGSGVSGGNLVQWDLATISSAQENATVFPLISDDAWIGETDLQAGSGSGKWAWLNGTQFYQGFSPTGRAINGLYNNFAAGQPDNDGEDCVHLYRTDGTWNNDVCTEHHAFLCEGPPTRVGTSPPAPASWSQSCVDAVANTCGATCANGTTAEDAGLCEPWFPEQTDPTCSSTVDLGVGLSCNDGTNGFVPICNHGGVDLPAATPITLLQFPAGSAQFGKTNPTGSTGTCTVSFPFPIHPGFCENAKSSDCPGLTLTAGTELMVNPAVAGAIAECHSDDNWSVYNDGACGVPICSGNASRADLHPVHLLIVLDESGSMIMQQPPTRWDQVTSALKTFFSDPNSAGLDVALRFFPDPRDGCGQPKPGLLCDPGPCGTPSVADGQLTVDPAPTDTQEAALLNALNTTTPARTNDTPTYAALQGAYAWVGEQQAANPNDKYVVVLVTDGQPGGCGLPKDSINTIAALTATAYTSGVLTYAIGIEDVSQANLNQIAAAGVGGVNNCLSSLKPNCSFFVCATQSCGTVGPDAGSPTVSFSQQLIDAMDQIAGRVVACTFDLPNVGNFDPAMANLEYVESASTTGTALTQVSGADADGDGVPDACTNDNEWYYNDPLNPTRATLCPATCARVTKDRSAQISIEIGCKPPSQITGGNMVNKVPTDTTREVTYVSGCPVEDRTQWDFMAYQTTTPGDSKVTFAARTAQTEADLPAATYHPLATADTTLGTSNCPLVPPTATCPVSVFDQLGSPDQFGAVLELSVELTPGTHGEAPIANNWNLTFSCVPGQ